MQKTHRRRRSSPESLKKRTLQLSKEHIRTLTPDELPLVAGGCPTGSWPSDATYPAQNVC